MTPIDDKRINKIHVNVAILITQMDNITKWMEKHEKNNQTDFDRLYRKINNLYKYATSVAIIAGAAGFFMGIS